MWPAVRRLPRHDAAASVPHRVHDNDADGDGDARVDASVLVGVNAPVNANANGAAVDVVAIGTRAL